MICNRRSVLLKTSKPFLRTSLVNVTFIEEILNGEHFLCSVIVQYHVIIVMIISNNIIILNIFVSLYYTLIRLN